MVGQHNQLRPPRTPHSRGNKGCWASVPSLRHLAIQVGPLDHLLNGSVFRKEGPSQSQRSIFAPNSCAGRAVLQLTVPKCALCGSHCTGLFYYRLCLIQFDYCCSVKFSPNRNGWETNDRTELCSQLLHVLGQHGATKHLRTKLVGNGFSQLVVMDGSAARSLPNQCSLPTI